MHSRLDHVPVSQLETENMRCLNMPSIYLHTAVKLGGRLLKGTEMICSKCTSLDAS